MRMSLRYKFVLAFLGFTVVVTVAFTSVTTQRLHEHLSAQYAHHALHMAAHAAKEVIKSQILGVAYDPALIAHNILDEEVIYAQIVSQGKEWTFYSQDPVPLPPLTGVDRSAWEEIRPAQGTSYLDLVYPLREGWSVLTQFGHEIDPAARDRLEAQGLEGYVRLGVSLARLEHDLQRELLLLTGLSLGVMALGILAGWGLYRTILGPIEHLSATVRLFGAGNAYARARVRSGDEIETLANEFNAMANSIVHQRDALRQTNEQLERANRVKSVFLATISHELRTPLHAILGYTSLLLDEVNLKLNDAGRQYARAIQRAGKHLLTLIQNVLDFSKLEAGAERPQFATVDAAALVREVLESQHPLAEAKGLALRSELEPELHLTTDPLKLKQVLLNLINNAIKYTPQGHVRVIARTRSGAAYFAVEDTGVGIEPQDQETLFDPFVRAERPGSQQEGIGLGLAVAKRYVALLGGQLQLESAPGRGSRFWFVLPKEEG